VAQDDVQRCDRIYPTPGRFYRNPGSACAPPVCFWLVPLMST